MSQIKISPNPELINKPNLILQLGRTPLIFAVLGDHPDNAEVLLQNGARPDIVDNLGRNALHWAIFLGNFSVAKSFSIVALSIMIPSITTLKPPSTQISIKIVLQI